MNIKIRLMDEGEIHQVNEVYNNAYGNIRPDEYFAWEFINGPWGKAIYVLAEDLDRAGNKIIGTQCAIPIMFTNGEKEILTAKSEDTFVHPDYRGQKLFDKMYDVLFEECKKAGIKYIWGFTYARKPFEKIGFQVPFDTIQGILVRSPFKAYKVLASFNPENKIKQKINILLGSFYSYLKYLSKSRFPQSITTVFKDSFEGYQSLINGVLLKNGLWCIDQNKQFVEWRLVHNPYDNKFIQMADNDQKASSLFIFNKKQSGLVYLEDLKIKEGINSDEKIAGLKSAINLLKQKSNFSVIRFWGFPTNVINQNEISLLKKAGFVFVNRGTSFVWKSLVDEKSDEISAMNVFLSRLFTQGNR